MNNWQNNQKLIKKIPRQNKVIRHDESQMQIACKRWFDTKFPLLAKLLFAIPNGGKRNTIEASRLKAEGVVAGVSDMILLIPRKGYGSLCIEFKTLIGRQSISQRQWQQIAQRQGNKYIVVRSTRQFIKEIDDYLH